MRHIAVAGALLISSSGHAASAASLEQQCVEAGDERAFCACLDHGLRDAVRPDLYAVFVRVKDLALEHEQNAREGEWWQSEPFAKLAQELDLPLSEEFAPLRKQLELEGVPPANRELLARYRSVNFRLGSVARPCQREHAARLRAREAADQAQAVASLERRIEADLGSHVDLSVFGIRLGERLDLPMCPGQLTIPDLLAILAGVGKGVEQTCAGDPATTGAAELLKELQKLFGLGNARLDEPWVLVRLADRDCPVWLRLGGLCVVSVVVEQGLAIGASVVPAGSPEVQSRVERELTAKYGRKPIRGDTTTCTHRTSGATREADDLLWSLPGLHVTYLPLVDCIRGRIDVELSYLRERRAAAEAAREAAEPRM